MIYLHILVFYVKGVGSGGKPVAYLNHLLGIKYSAFYIMVLEEFKHVSIYECVERERERERVLYRSKGQKALCNRMTIMINNSKIEVNQTFQTLSKTSVPLIKEIH